MEYDLEERTKKFGKKILEFILTINQNQANKNVIGQLARSVTSVGANYCEANAASSKKDFTNKIFISKKEIQETKFWIEMLAVTNPEQKDKLREFWKEAHEQTLIFGKIVQSLRHSKI